MEEWVVTEQDSGKKLQVFLKMKCGPTISARQIKRALDAGQCKLNGKVERFASKLVGRGDRVAVGNLESEKTPSISIDILDRLLYEDEDLFAYNKPAGVASQDPLLLDQISIYCKKAILLHRLDRETTGILLFAKNNSTAEAIEALFKQRKIKKTYRTIVDGVPKNKSGVVDNFLGKLNTYHGQSIWGAVPEEKGVRARTVWQLEKASSTAALITCYPETGRTHQIRVHMSGLGHPVLGDYQYGRSFKCPQRPPRLMLHAGEITFEHPRTKQQLVIQAPLPPDFNEMITLIFGKL